MELEKLLDNYFAARSIKVDDQRTIAGGVNDLVQATMAIEALLAQEYSRGRRDELNDAYYSQEIVTEGYYEGRLKELEKGLEDGE